MFNLTSWDILVLPLNIPSIRTIYLTLRSSCYDQEIRYVWHTLVSHQWLNLRLCLETHVIALVFLCGSPCPLCDSIQSYSPQRMNMSRHIYLLFTICKAVDATSLKPLPVYNDISNMANCKLTYVAHHIESTCPQLNMNMKKILLWYPASMDHPGHVSITLHMTLILFIE